MKTKLSIFAVVITCLLVTLTLSCKKEAPKVIPTLSTTAATNITSTSATSGGAISFDGNSPITLRGVCWGANQSPTISDSKTNDGTGIGSFTSSISGLTPGGTYYARAYATNAVGIAYGNQVTLTTLSILPTITTTAFSAVTSTTATGGGNITNDGGSAVTARGVCWSALPSPTILLNSKTTDGSGTGSFTSSIIGLTLGTTYYVRAYATNSIGTAYGVQVTATTTAILPTLTSTALTAITSSTATSGGNITSDGGAVVTARGVCWSTSQTPIITNSKTSDGTGTGSFTSSITNLVPATTYYVRAYATNNIGTAYGDQLTATTSTIPPIITTTATSAITSTTATSGGDITSDGGAGITARGVCWSTSQNPTTADTKTNNGMGTGSFVSSITGLTPGTTYYVKAYATNIAGTAYGNPVNFTTGVIPVAAFSATPTTITAGQSVQFTDQSTNTPTSWSWIFGDGGTSTTKNPSHTYASAGTYTVALTAINSFGSNTQTKTSYITVNSTVTDIDGNVYSTVTIGTQVWMAENLKTTKYRNGNSIGTTTPATLDINSQINPKYQWAYEGNESNVATYGRLYTWYAATDSRNVCPTGWHVPTDSEWTTLTTFLGGESIAGGKLKEAGTNHWNTPNTGATNSSGFTALPGGYRYPNGTFYDIGYNGYWWSSTEYNTNYAWARTMAYYFSDAYRHDYFKTHGFSVRCVRDMV